MAGGSRGGVLVAVLAGSLVAAVLGAGTLPGWADKLPESAAATALGDAARGLERVMATAGLTRPYDAIRAAVRWMEARKFSPASGEDPTDKE